jgi:mannose-6-phosphate isomerase
VYEGNHVVGGAWAGRTLGDVAGELGVELLGETAVEQKGQGFPLLIKLLHSREWLSVQVHPNDEQAARLEGLNNVGKTEAWHVLEADPGARVIFGLNGEHSPAELDRMAREGRFEDALRYVPVERGDTLFTPAGCVHAIGPGLLIYEVQQTSDITYRLYDWNRPVTAGRALHLDKGLQVIGGCENESTACGQTPASDDEAILADCAYFRLEQVRCSDNLVRMDTRGRSFHALTVTEGEVEVQTRASALRIGPLETVLIPAALGSYELRPIQPFQVLLSRMPETGAGP